MEVLPVAEVQAEDREAVPPVEAEYQVGAEDRAAAAQVEAARAPAVGKYSVAVAGQVLIRREPTIHFNQAETVAALR